MKPREKVGLGIANSASALARPYLVGLGLLVALPAAGAIGLSLTEFSGVAAPVWVGLSNYDRLLGDAAFWRSLGNTAVFVAIALPLRLVAAVGLALLLQRPRRGHGVARVAGYLPTVVPDVAYALLWLWLLNPFYGPLALAADALGIARPGFFSSPWGARVSVAVMAAFQVGEAFVVALAARRAIPDRFYDIAAVEGATPWFSLSRVTLPAMAPILALLALRDVVLALQVGFVPALVVTDGGPRYATTFLPLLVYRTAFRYFRLGYASALTVMLFLITGVIVWVQYRLARRWQLR